MQYNIGNIGRIINIRFESEEDVLSGLKKIVRENDINFANVFLLGACKNPEIVAGPKNDDFPPIPNCLKLDGVHEILAFGNILNISTENVRLHLHGNVSKGENIAMGCFRKKLETYITIEAFLYEIKDADVSKYLDAETGIDLLAFS